MLSCWAVSPTSLGDSLCYLGLGLESGVCPVVDDITKR